MHRFEVSKGVSKFIDLRQVAGIEQCAGQDDREWCRAYFGGSGFMFLPVSAEELHSLVASCQPELGFSRRTVRSPMPTYYPEGSQ